MQKIEHNARINDFLLSFVLLSGAYLGQILAYRIGTDSELAYLRDDSLVWLQQGRWLTYLFEQYVYTNPIVPAFAILLFVGLFTWFCLSFLNDVVGIKSTDAVLLTLVTGSFISWTYLIAFPANLFPFAVAIMLAFVAAGLCDICVRQAQEKSYRKMLIPMVLMTGLCCFIAGIYEAGLILFACLSALPLVPQLKSKISENIKLLAQFSVIVVITVIAAYLFSNLICSILLHFRESTRTIVQHNVSVSTIIDAPKAEISQLFKLIDGYLTGGDEIYGQFTLVPVIIMTLFFLSLISRLAGNWQRSLFIVLIASGIFLVAGSINLMALNYGTLRMSVAFPIAFMGLMVIESLLRPEFLKKIAPPLYLICFIFNAYILSLVAMSEINIRRYDEQLAYKIADAAIIMSEGGPADLIFLDVHGQPSFEHRGPKYESSPTGVSAFSWWPARHRSVKFIGAMGYEQFRAPMEELHKANEAIVAEMPSWPKEGSMILLDGVIILKF